jgi:hypothetical protein
MNSAAVAHNSLYDDNNSHSPKGIKNYSMLTKRKNIQLQKECHILLTRASYKSNKEYSARSALTLIRVGNIGTGVYVP